MPGLIPVGVLGATGMVGQKYVELLQDHPWFSLQFVAASERSQGKSYAQAVAGRSFFSKSLSPKIADLEVHSIDSIATAQRSCKLLFSAIDSTLASTYEELYAAQGLAVLSNASWHRKSDDVPMLIPEINPEHLDLIPYQRSKRGFDSGFIVVKPNCSLQSFLLPLFALHRNVPIRTVTVTTLQAVSGAGHPGVSSYDLLDNFIPYIAGEEEKSEQEPLKILSRLHENRLLLETPLVISAQCNRIPVIDGHTACVSFTFDTNSPPPSERILHWWETFRGLPQELALPLAPERPIVYLAAPDRPQPRLDRDRERGMAISVGRLRPCPNGHYRFVGLSHNTVRGAAGGGILNAELLVAKGWLRP